MRQPLCPIVIAALAIALFFALLPRNKHHFTEPANKSQGLSVPSLQTADAPASGNFRWNNIESPDYREYVRNLRASGCPEPTVEDIIIADVNALYWEKARPIMDEQKRSYKAAYKDVANAVAGSATDGIAGATRKQLTRLDAERTTLVLKLLGHTPEAYKLLTPPWKYALDDPFFVLKYNYLPFDKATAARELDTRLNADMRAATRPGVPWSMQEAKVIDQLEVQFEEKLSKLLSPEEFAAWLIHDSSAASRVRAKLAGVSVSDSELSRLVGAERDFQAKHGHYVSQLEGMPEDPHLARVKMEDDKALWNKFNEVLGDERYADVTRLNDPVFRDARTFAEENNLTSAQATAIYQIQKDTQTKAASARYSTDDESVRRQLTSEAVDTAKQKLTELLGTQTYESYARSRAGKWITSSNPAEVQKVVGTTYSLFPK